MRYQVDKLITHKTETHPPPRITARLGNSSKLNASSDVIPNSCTLRQQQYSFYIHPKILNGLILIKNMNINNVSEAFSRVGDGQWNN